MSLPVPSIVDRTKKWFRLLKRPPQSPSISHDETAGTTFFSNAEDITINGGQFVGANDVNEMKLYYINNVVSNRQAVFELLESYTCLDATKDSSARHPPPKCHPETRLKIREKLRRWLVEEYDEWKMMWVRGSAGTGKSAVAQSFADSCDEEQNLGGSYFFSRTAGRSQVKFLVSTLVYQLARSVPEYHSFIDRRLAKDRLLLQNSPPVQFRKLIIEPFATLQRHRRLKPIVIILDGLDECEGENAQREILEMITNAIRTNPDLPLRWLIFSRPEAHLKNAFSLNSECGREELIIDDECRENVERYVKDRLLEIKAAYNDVTPADWPPREKLQELLDAVSGLFVFASTCLHFIADPDEADPDSQLDSLLMFLRRSQNVGSKNPLVTLDLLYSRVLEDISPSVFKTTWRILAYMTLQSKIFRPLSSAQALANFLRLDQRAFCKATRGLHSVMRIPDPADADKTQLQFYHASFQDFLCDPKRAGRFVVGEYKAMVDILHSDIYWYDIATTNFHTHNGKQGSKQALLTQQTLCSGWEADKDVERRCLPGLTWASEENRLLLSQSIMGLLRTGYLHEVLDMQWDGPDEGLIVRLSNVDFRDWTPSGVHGLVSLCRLDPSTLLVRVEPFSRTDHQLLEYFNLMIGNSFARPAIFPLRQEFLDGVCIQEYFFIGYDVKSVIVWRTKSPATGWYIHSLRCDQEPSQAQISEYATYLQSIKWDEEKAKLGLQEGLLGDR